MKKLIVVGLALLTGACTVPVGFGLNSAKAISGDENHVVVFDQNGVRQKSATDVAEAYCAGYNKVAEFKSRGGEPQDCVSKALNYCVTFSCN